VYTKHTEQIKEILNLGSKSTNDTSKTCSDVGPGTVTKYNSTMTL